ENKTYSTDCSCVVTHHSTDSAIRSLTRGERTGSRILFCLWPYVMTLLGHYLRPQTLNVNLDGLYFLAYH
ncbi:hypothetical protein BJ508DRAFT_345265, partial [Ascobolus immersus RN42]